MPRLKEDSLSRSALTILEMVPAMSIVVVVFAALVPQFRAVLNSWDTREGNSETLQNARVLLDHLKQNLTKAARITDVSAPATTSGYIEYEDIDGADMLIDDYGEPEDAKSKAGVIGAYSTSTSECNWHGILDDVRLYDRAITANEMSALASGSGGGGGMRP